MLNAKLMLVTLLGALLVVGACRHDVDELPPGSRARVLEAPPQPLTAGDPAGEESRIDPRLQPFVELAVEKLVLMLRADPGKVEVLEAHYVTWPDSSLGCPRPGMNYMQVLTDGYRIVLRHSAISYHYHGKRGHRPFHCERPAKPVVGQPSEASS